MDSLDSVAVEDTVTELRSLRHSRACCLECVSGAGRCWHWTKPATTADWADDVAAAADAVVAAVAAGDLLLESHHYY